MPNYALSFNGSTDYIEIPFDPSLDLVSKITVESWIKFTSITECDVFQMNNGCDGYCLWVSPTQGMDLIWLKQCQEYGTYEFLILETGKWYYVVVTFDAPTLKLYLNGTLLFSKPNAPFTFSSNTGPLIIGNGLDGFFNGVIDEFRIYNRVLTQTEITYNYNNGLGRHLPYSRTNLVLWMHMNEGSGPTTYDETVNNNDGTIYGATWVPGFPFELPPTDLLFSDTFTGTNGTPPHKGRWDSFLTRSDPTTTFDSKTVQILSNELSLICNPATAGAGSVNTMSRAEFKLPFILETKMRVNPPV